MERNRFSLIEIMVGLSIIIVIMGLSMGAYMTVMKGAKRKKALVRMKQLEMAISSYRTQYLTLPFTLQAGTAADLLIEDSSTPSFKNLIDTLGGQDSAMNPRQTAFLELDPDGQYRDSWEGDANESGFVVVLDLDYDDNIADDKIAGAGELTRKVVIWSKGPDGQYEANLTSGDNGALNADNVNSW